MNKLVGSPFFNVLTVWIILYMTEEHKNKISNPATPKQSG